MMKLEYRIDGPYLDRQNGPPSAIAETLPPRRPDILALVPSAWTPIPAVRKAVEGMLIGATVKARESEWYKLRQGWADADQIEQSTSRGIRRIGPMPQ